MIRIIKADGEEKQFLAEVEKRAGQVNADVEKTVRAILADVKENGDAAVKSYTAKFDCPNAQYYRVPDEAIQDALTEANENSPEFVNAMLNAVENITAFHNRQKREGFCVTEENGVIMGQRVRGLDRVGLYVPGGTAAYPSSVLMNAIPAKIAGVKEIIMVTPPLKDGTANKDILVAKLDIYLYPNPLVCEFAITTVIPTDTPSRHNVSNMSLSCKYKSFNAVKLSINKII